MTLPLKKKKQPKKQPASIKTSSQNAQAFPLMQTSKTSSFAIYKVWFFLKIPSCKNTTALIAWSYTDTFVLTHWPNNHSSSWRPHQKQLCTACSLEHEQSQCKCLTQAEFTCASLQQMQDPLATFKSYTQLVSLFAPLCVKLL